MKFVNRHSTCCSLICDNVNQCGNSYNLKVSTVFLLKLIFFFLSREICWVNLSVMQAEEAATGMLHWSM
jgi:hypothetical protein